MVFEKQVKTSNIRKTGKFNTKNIVEKIIKKIFLTHSKII
ncbi:hypothetical protein RV14_GL000453 [Enterococcus ratti]|uniref:Uncharacterized protein n=1 Tax=Enterococcus ratti TaxID=150033 RepID=A0A1L8WI69_9ENTE|nr:hypothetical protein RV14_GL000453 [Enterococcus ratti]